MSFRDTDLRLLAERDDAYLSGRAISDVERRGIGRVELRELLLKGLDEKGEGTVCWEKSFERYEHLLDNRVRVHFADGSTEDGDLLIGADGCNSKVRFDIGLRGTGSSSFDLWRKYTQLDRTDTVSPQHLHMSHLYISYNSHFI